MAFSLSSQASLAAIEMVAAYLRGEGHAVIVATDPATGGLRLEVDGHIDAGCFPVEIGECPELDITSETLH